MLTLGLIINPFAGIGGSVALKGSDGADTVTQALALGAEKKSNQRAAQALAMIPRQAVQFVTCAGEMGEDLLTQLGFGFTLIAPPSDTQSSSSSNTTAKDTQYGAQQILKAKVDLIVFAGGDGTARDIYDVVQDKVAVLGIPAGVKIHSAVYAVTPRAAGLVIQQLLAGSLVDVKEQDVRDIDEQAFRENRVQARLYGEMRVPQAGQFIQHVKQGGVEVEELVLQDIAEFVADEMLDDVVYFIGSGKTTEQLMQHLSIENTLLGVDAILNQQLLKNDLTEHDILSVLEQHPAKAIISIMGGQGHVIGRGNQQFSAQVLAKIGKENIQVISTKAKITALEGRPLLIDSGQPELDKAWSGSIEVTTGYRDQIIYPLTSF